MTAARIQTLFSDYSRAATERLRSFYEAQGVASAEKELIDVVTVNDSTTAVRTRDWLFDTHGMVIAEWESAYLVNESADGAKISGAMPSGEIEMWKNRGTPLPAM